MLTDEFREIKFCPHGIGLIVERLLGGLLSGIFFHEDCLPVLSNLGHFYCCRVHRWWFGN